MARVAEVTDGPEVGLVDFFAERKAAGPENALVRAFESLGYVRRQRVPSEGRAGGRGPVTLEALADGEKVADVREQRIDEADGVLALAKLHAHLRDERLGVARAEGVGEVPDLGDGARGDDGADVVGRRGLALAAVAGELFEFGDDLPRLGADAGEEEGARLRLHFQLEALAEVGDEVRGRRRALAALESAAEVRDEAVLAREGLEEGRGPVDLQGRDDEAHALAQTLLDTENQVGEVSLDVLGLADAVIREKGGLAEPDRLGTRAEEAVGDEGVADGAQDGDRFVDRADAAVDLVEAELAVSLGDEAVEQLLRGEGDAELVVAADKVG